MNISLTPELERFIAAKVKTGLYHSASEVVREALRLLRDLEERRARLEDEIRIGLDELDRGERIPGEEVFKELDRRREQRRRRQK